MKLKRPERPERLDRSKIYLEHAPANTVQIVGPQAGHFGERVIRPAGTRTDSDGDGLYQEQLGGPHGAGMNRQPSKHRHKRRTRTSAPSRGKR